MVVMVFFLGIRNGTGTGSDWTVGGLGRRIKGPGLGLGLGIVPRLGMRNSNGNRNETLRSTLPTHQP